MRDYSNQTRNRAAERDVEITGIETCVVVGNFDWNLVEIHTDGGVTGIGESYRGGAVVDLMHYMEDFLIGENPLDVERLFRRMIQETSGHGGTTGKVVTTATGIEIALWDAAGKILGLPVYQLLGGKYRDATDTFFHHFGTKVDVESEIPDDDTEHSTVLGIDLGIEQIAVTSTGMFWNGDCLNHRRREYEWIRSKLQQTRTESAYRTIEQMGDRETR